MNVTAGHPPGRQAVERVYIYLRKFVGVAPAFEVCPQTRSSMSTASAPANACNTPTVGCFFPASICET